MRTLKKRYIVLLALAAVLLIGGFLWFQSQNVDEGYVYAAGDSDLWIMELDAQEVKEMTEEEILLSLEEMSSESEGAFYDIPLINRITGMDFEEGDKAKVYWSGMVLQSKPPIIKGTSLIRKTGD